MLRILVTSDPHWSANPRDEYRHDFVKTLGKLILEHKVDELYLLGDLTESKDKHDAELVNRVVGHVDRLSGMVDRTVILKGNHDWLNDPSMPFFKFLGRLPNVKWINSPTLLEHGMLFLPHTTDYKRDWAEWIKTKFEGIALVLTHNTFEGTLGDNSTRLDGIPPSVFPKDLTVLSGDVHNPQRIGPVTYVGAPYTVDFGDAYEPRLLLLDDDGRLESIDCRGPQKMLVEVKSLRELDKVRSLQKGDIIKVRVTIDRAQTAVWHEMRDEVRVWGEEHGYRVHVVQPVVEDADRRLDTAKRRRVSKTDEQLFSEYCRRMGIDDRTTEVGRKLLGEA